MVSLRKKHMLLNPQVLKIQRILTKSSDSIRPSMADTSSSYLYFFIVPCQYSTTFIYFWQLFILFFGTNILIQCQFLFVAYFLFRRISISNESKWNKNGQRFFLEY